MGISDPKNEVLLNCTDAQLSNTSWKKIINLENTNLVWQPLAGSILNKIRRSTPSPNGCGLQNFDFSPPKYFCLWIQSKQNILVTSSTQSRKYLKWITTEMVTFLFRFLFENNIASFPSFPRKIAHGFLKIFVAILVHHVSRPQVKQCHFRLV